MDTGRVTPGRVLPTISTTPNSPSVWAKLRRMPVTRPRTDSGITTRRNVFFFQAEDGIRDPLVTGVQTCDLPISGLLQRYGSARGPRTRKSRIKTHTGR